MKIGVLQNKQGKYKAREVREKNVLICGRCLIVLKFRYEQIKISYKTCRHYGNYMADRHVDLVIYSFITFSLELLTTKGINDPKNYGYVSGVFKTNHFGGPNSFMYAICCFFFTILLLFISHPAYNSLGIQLFISNSDSQPSNLNIFVEKYRL